MGANGPVSACGAVMAAGGTAQGCGTVLVFAGGDPVSRPRIDGALGRQFPVQVVAADSGADHARAAGFDVDVAVGDFDSISSAGHDWLAASGARLEPHPADKSETDLELALLVAASFDPVRVLVTGIGGGRADHHLANLLLLADRRFAPFAVDGLEERADYLVVHRSREIEGHIGQVVTLLPLGGAASGVRTRGLAYPLLAETLPAGSPRGVSNVMSQTRARIDVGCGTVLVVRSR